MDSTNVNTPLSFGDILEHDIVTEKGVLLLKKGTQLRESHLHLLDHFNWDYRINYKKESDVLGQKNSQIKIEKLINDCINQYSSILEKIKIGELPDLNGFFNGLKETYDEIKGLDNAIDVIYGFQDLDQYTYQHSVNVSLLAGLIGKIMDFSDADICLLINMGIVHDIGKVKVDNNILNKNCSLTNQEYAEIKKHTLHGYQLLIDILGNEKIAEGALLHHERLDGTGYPIGKSGQNIPFLVQVISIADSFDAICTERSYHEQRSPFFAINILIQDAVSHKLNSEVTYTFVRYLMNQYKGKKITINNGEIGEIIYVPYDEPHKPIVRCEDRLYDLRNIMLKIVDFVDLGQKELRSKKPTL
ncbi:HD-GYP domain-containing protein [Aquibacillus kalidii]|uniref:HD-GYP domain-containing protein n=1 Tax=Aquibacillus kalidii TaxID=2762597 RepID=UPI00164771E3|nr:HD-GYP domain-containing protein [Aquibacillus kalidii]